MSETQLAVVDSAKYMALSNKDAMLALKENLAGEQISVGDFQFVKMPTGGGTTWIIPSPFGERAEKAIRGVLCFVGKRRTLWPSAIPTGDPPVCRSDDLENGMLNYPMPDELQAYADELRQDEDGKLAEFSDPPGKCEDCIFNQFATGEGQRGRTRGKRCKESRMLFVLEPKSLMPIIVVAQPGSLKVIRKWLFQMTAAGLPYTKTEVELTLKAVENEDGITYAQIEPKIVALLSDEDRGKIDKTYKPLLNRFFSFIPTEQAPDENDEE